MNWAYQSNNTTKEDTSNHHHIFVGDLSNEVNDEVLLQAFSIYGGVSEARVMWDMKTGRSRGYGFVAFRNREEAQKALDGMNGEFLGSRAIRCNWANQKGQPSVAQHQAMVQMGMAPTGYAPQQQQPYPTQNTMQSYQTVLAQAEPWVTTVYVGNITTYTGVNDLVPLFQSFGYVGETRVNSDRGFAFIKMDTHENAANAICQLQGYQINGRPMRLNVSIFLCKQSDTTLTSASGVRKVQEQSLLLPMVNTMLSLLRLANLPMDSKQTTSLNMPNHKVGSIPLQFRAQVLTVGQTPPNTAKAPTASTKPVTTVARPPPTATPNTAPTATPATATLKGLTLATSSDGRPSLLNSEPRPISCSVHTTKMTNSLVDELQCMSCQGIKRWSLDMAYANLESESTADSLLFEGIGGGESAWLEDVRMRTG